MSAKIAVTYIAVLKPSPNVHAPLASGAASQAISPLPGWSQRTKR